MAQLVVRIMQEGQMVGTPAATFEPSAICRRLIMYKPRQGDFRCEGNVWPANKMLGLEILRLCRTSGSRECRSPDRAWARRGHCCASIVACSSAEE